jgi:hypothetical protein
LSIGESLLSVLQEIPQAIERLGLSLSLMKLRTVKGPTPLVGIFQPGFHNQPQHGAVRGFADPREHRQLLLFERN